VLVRTLIIGSCHGVHATRKVGTAITSSIEAMVGVPSFIKPATMRLSSKLLGEAGDRAGMRLLAYCLMPNHFHLAVWPVYDGDLSRYMMWLMTAHVLAITSTTIRAAMSGKDVFRPSPGKKRGGKKRGHRTLKWVGKVGCLVKSSSQTPCCQGCGRGETKHKTRATLEYSEPVEPLGSAVLRGGATGCVCRQLLGNGHVCYGKNPLERNSFGGVSGGRE
jgi:hypothetical protein